MKGSKRKKLKIDWEGTKKIRAEMASEKPVKITINIDSGSLSALKAESSKTGVPYQRLLNALLKESLQDRATTDSRLDKLEKELEKVKRKLAA